MRITANIFILMLLFIGSAASADKLSDLDYAGLKAYEAGDYETAFKDYSITAQQGDVNAQVLLGNLYDKGEGVLQDHVKAYEWYIKAAQKGYSTAQFFVGWDYYHGTGAQQDYAKALYWFTKGAQQGEIISQYSLGLMYAKGLGVQQDYAKANYWFTKSAQQGYKDAQYNLGISYLYGNGVPEDNTKAAEWFHKAAVQGDADAETKLGVMNEYAIGIPKDYALAITLFRKSAEQGNADAQENLGIAYDNGIGVPQDYVQAVAWYKKAAAQGNPDAQNDLGTSYAHGRGVPQDYMQAVAWYSKAAEQGNADAQFNLGLMYFHGYGVQQDPVQAARLYREAAGQGLVIAQDYLGVMYEFGLGVPQNYVAAYALYNIVAAQDNNGQNKAANNRSKLMSSMTPAQVEDGQALTREMQRIGMLKALDAYLESGTQLVPSSSNADIHPAQSTNISGEDYYLQQVLGPNGHIDKALHDQFWQQFNDESEHDVTLAINWIKGSILVTQEYEKELWNSALLSYNNHQVIKTERLIELEKEVPEMAKKSLPWPPGSPQYTETLANFNSGWTNSMEDAKRLLDAAANHKPLIGINGQVRQIDEQTIEQASSSINASITRLNKLLDKHWNGN